VIGNLTTGLALELAKLLIQSRSSSIGVEGDATITIPLLRGSGSHIFAEPATQAERNVLYAIWEFVRFRQTFAVEIAKEYLTVLSSLNEIENADENYRNLIVSSRRSRRLADAGRATEVEVDQALQNELRARNRWVSARELYKKRMDAFKRLIGLPPDAEILLETNELNRLFTLFYRMKDEMAPESALLTNQGVPPADAPIELAEPGNENAGPMEMDPFLAVKTALENRLDLRIAEGKVCDAQRKVILAADALRPEVTLFGRATLGEGKTIATSGLDHAKLRADKGVYSALLTIDLPFERTAERNTYRISLINLEKSVRDAQKLEDEIKLSVRNKLRAMYEARESREIQARALLATSAQSGGPPGRRSVQPLEEGQEVRERQELIHLPTTTAAKVEAAIPEASLDKVRPGLPVRVTVDAIPGEILLGKVAKIALLPDAQSAWLNPDLKVYSTDIHLENRNRAIRAGMSCKAEIIVEQYPEATYVPVQPVLRVNGQPTVYVVRRGNWNLERSKSAWTTTGSFGSLENDHVSLRAGVRDIIQALDKRGILHSIASKNDPEIALKKLEEHKLNEYFIYPQISWGPKSDSIKAIVKLLNIKTGAIAFVDDQVYERDEVRFSCPEVLCIDAAEIDRLLDLPALMPAFVTEESTHRRSMYLSDIKRNEVETAFDGPREEFLETLGMRLSIYPATLGDLRRAEELTVRTHQLNTTGYTYSYEELNLFRQSENHMLLVAGLEDRFGTYGTIGVALIETLRTLWTIKLLLMSCRVMSRGVGSVFINHIRNLARAKRVTLRAEFMQTEFNRIMYMTYKFAHFSEIKKNDRVILFENDLSKVIAVPQYLQIATAG
jgi:FkbH-like protein